MCAVAHKHIHAHAHTLTYKYFLNIGRKLQEERKYHKEAEGEEEESHGIHHYIKTEKEAPFGGWKGNQKEGLQEGVNVPACHNETHHFVC